MPKWFHAGRRPLRRDVRRLAVRHRQRADYESTMGLVQKIFYYHMPSAWMFLTAAIVCGVASVALSVRRGDPRHDRTALAAAELTVLFGAAHAGHRSALGAEGVGHVVDVGRADHRRAWWAG